MHFLANVKNIPIGMKPKENSGVPVTTLNKFKYDPPTEASSQTFNVCLPLLSGVVGALATKLLPTGLISNQAMFISVQLAPASEVVQLSMDPCRRLPGTSRDFVSSVGAKTAIKDTVSANRNSVYEDSNPNTASQVEAQVGWAPTAYTTALEDTKNPQSQIAATMRTMKPWLYGRVGTASVDAMNTNIETPDDIDCPYAYGSYLSESQAQTSRMNFDDGDKVTTAPSNNASGAIGLTESAFTYNISNINFVGDEIVIPPEFGASIVEKVQNTGGIRIKTNSVRTYQLNVANASSQTIIIPCKVGAADSIIFSFRNQKQKTTNEGFYYDTNSSINPFASIAPIDQAVPGVLGQAAALTRVRQNTPFSYQLRIGNTYMPIQPIRSSTEWSVETLKAMHGLTDQNTSIDTQCFYGDTGKISETADGGFFTPFIDRSLLDDQINKNTASRTGNFLQGVFMPPTSNSLVIIDLNGWNGVNDRGSSGIFLNNGTVSLLLDGCAGLNVAGQTYTGTAIIPHEAILTLVPGGQAMWTY